jgi:ribonuclease HI
MDIHEIVVHTDGSCRKNPGPGGWGACVRVPVLGKRKDLLGAAEETTNNRMELQAPIEAIKFLRRKSRGPVRIKIYTDSQYVQKGITQWVRGWKIRGWQSSTGKVKNVDLWKELDALVQGLDIEWLWVRGHNGDKYNEVADRLANQGAVDAGYYED